ncbi:MAG: MFS transporter [Legionellales bacterium]|nr:MFS transporter [Legionellales bacterium]
MTVFLRPHILAIMCLSFGSGLSFMMLIYALPIWLKDINLSVANIGSMFLISLPYSLKFLWAPIVDQYRIPVLGNLLGQRRSWAIVSQLFLFISLVGLAFSNPAENIYITAVVAFIVSFFAATQDIVLDAYRIERLSDSELGQGVALSGVGFKLGMLAVTSGGLYLSTIYPWSTVYIIMALLGLIGPLMILFVKEPDCHKRNSSLEELYKIPDSNIIIGYFWQVIKCFSNITRHNNWQFIILFIFLFKISDTIPNTISTLFFMDLGFDKVQIGSAKTLGLMVMMVGSVLGGLLMSRFSIIQAILIGSGLQFSSLILLYGLSIFGCDTGNTNILLLIQVIQCLTCGAANVTFVTYLSKLCTGGFTATQFAVIYSFSSMSRIAIASISGWTLAVLNWESFFLYTMFISSLVVFPIIILKNGLKKNLVKAEA